MLGSILMTENPEDGVDVSLIRWTLSKTPAERLQILQDFVDFATEAWERNGIRPVLDNSENAD
jgi:hypothetical protein